MTREAPPFEVPVSIGAAQTIRSDRATVLVLAPEAYSTGAAIRVRARVDDSSAAGREPGDVLVPVAGREEFAIMVHSQTDERCRLTSTTGRSVGPTRWDMDFWLAENRWDLAPFRITWAAMNIDQVLDSVRVGALRGAAAGVLRIE